MNPSTKRSILRWTHLFATIPVLGAIYGRPEEVQQYIGAPRYIFVPVLILTGYWMYAGAMFAILGAATWLGVVYLADFWPAVLSQIALLIARKVWLVVRARQAK
ncbi:MAG TPA: hypothetical protein VHZ24_00610 [Pirellulales bacterium]|jgi:hypothetical protein|nr:hypothetical protein [Pirellulales bacterium]